MTSLSRSLRKRPTDAERLLWKYLRTKQIEGLKFRRQEPIGNYIVDFVCYERAVIVEVDGGQHSAEIDADRDTWLSTQGFKVLRFWNHDVLLNIEGVSEMIRETCLSRSSLKSPSPQSSPTGGEDEKHRE
jgi:very-short-patch-repair endonuclease